MSKIVFQYLNMDTKQFVESYSELVKQIAPGLASTIKCTHHPRNNIICATDCDCDHALYGGGSEYFTERDMILLCKKLSESPK